MPTAFDRKNSGTLQANLNAHQSRWGTDPCTTVTAQRTPSVGTPTVRTARGGGGPLEMQVPRGDWYSLHDADLPLVEARLWIANSLEAAKRSRAICVIGAGSGWVVDAVEEIPGDIRILVFEPDVACCLAMFERRDLSALIQAGRLMVVTGPRFEGADAAWRLLGRISTEPPIVIHPIVAIARKEATIAAARLIRKAIAGAMANERARRRFAVPYLLNTLRNVPSFETESDAAALFNLYPGKPVVIAAAGPSLNRNLEELKPHRDKVVLVAADTALRTMLSAGLAPDFVVAVDPSPANARHLMSLPSPEETALVAEASVERTSLEQFGGRTFLFRVGDHHPWPWLRSSGISVCGLRAWGSVLVTAFDFAVKLGGSPLIFIGADLAYTDGQPYCRGTIYEEDWAKRVAAGELLRDIWQHAISMRPTVIERHRFETVTTAPHLVQFRDGLLSAIRSVSARVVNATGAGILRDRRIEQLSLDDALRGSSAIERERLPRRGLSPFEIETLRRNTVRLVLRMGPSPDGWGQVLAEQEPADPSLPDQCESVRLALAHWAGATDGAPVNPDRTEAPNRAGASSGPEAPD